MRADKSKTLMAGLSKLRIQLDEGKPPPAPPRVLPLSKLALWPAVFQHRRPSEYASKAHVRELCSVVKQGKALDPLTVWWDGKRWACIDGHHRTKAYQFADFQSDVPVTVFVGSLEAALAQAARGNSRDRLPMSPTEKANAAWRLVVAAEGLTKAATAEAAGVSERTVATMRRVVTALKGSGERELDVLSWQAARARWQGLASEDTQWNEKAEQRAQELALAIRKRLPPSATRNTELFARALEILDSRLPRELQEFWGGHPEGAEQ